MINLLNDFATYKVNELELLKIGDNVECVLVHRQNLKCLTQGKKYEVLDVRENDSFRGAAFYFYIKDDNGRKKKYAKSNSQFKRMNLSMPNNGEVISQEKWFSLYESMDGSIENNSKIAQELKDGLIEVAVWPVSGGEHRFFVKSDFLAGSWRHKILRVIRVLSKERLPLQNEKDLQEKIQRLLYENKLVFNREQKLDEDNIPDLFDYDIAIEVKTKGSRREIFRQCERYCKFDQVKALILITNRSMGLPKEINGKPCYLVNLGKAWL